MSDILPISQGDLLDAKLFARQPLQVTAATVTSTERPIECDLGAAAPATAPAWNLDNLELRALGHSSLRREIETKPHGVGQHGAQTPYLEQHASDACALRPRGHERDDLLGNGELMHRLRHPPGTG